MNPSTAIIQSLLVSPLLIGDLPNAAQFDRQSLAASDHGVELNFDQKLGHLYEDAFASLVTSSPKVKLLERNLQVQRNSHATLGELDFLLRDLQGHLTHLEIAAKFYLAVKTDNGICFPGPDSRDNYHRKLQRLVSHQLTLTERYKRCLPPEYRDADIRVKQLIYGCLFDHITAPQTSCPEFSNPDCRRGRWLHQRELSDHFPDQSQFDLIPKHLWPVPIELLAEMPLQRWRNDKPVDRCQMLRINGSACPYFVAPDEYPQQS